MTQDFETLLYKTKPPVATITLNRPDQLNTIVPPMPDEIEAAIGLAERDPQIKVVLVNRRVRQLLAAPTRRERAAIHAGVAPGSSSRLGCIPSTWPMNGGWML